MNKVYIALLAVLLIIALAACGAPIRVANWQRFTAHYHGDSPPELPPGAVVIRSLPEMHMVEFSADAARAKIWARRQGNAILLEPAHTRALQPVGDIRLARNSQAWHINALNLERAWARSRGCNVTVAIVDQLPDLTHPDLRGRWVAGYDTISQQTIEEPQEGYGPHGTHVAGLVAANGRAKGVAPCARLMPIRIFDESGYAGDAAVADGLKWAVDHGANVINMSWGGPGYSLALAKALDYALSKGVVLVAAAGNESVGTPMYPAAFPGVIAVAASDGLNRLSSFSSYGYFVDLAAPGEDIFSTLPLNSYGYFSGTSMAAPLVSGAAALLLAQRNLDPWQIHAILLSSGDPLRGDPAISLVQPAAALSATVPSAQGCMDVVVSSSDGRGVRLADLKLSNDTGKVYWRKTDGLGRATFRDIEPGDYRVQAAGPEWPDLRDSERVVAQVKATARAACPRVLLKLQTSLTVTVSWQHSDIDLAIKEGNWGWATSKTGARFGQFSSDATDGGEESYRFQGGVSEADIGIGLLNHSGEPVDAHLLVQINGTSKEFEVRVPPGDGVYPIDELRVLSRP